MKKSEQNYIVPRGTSYRPPQEELAIREASYTLIADLLASGYLVKSSKRKGGLEVLPEPKRYEAGGKSYIGFTVR